MIDRQVLSPAFMTAAHLNERSSGVDALHFASDTDCVDLDDDVACADDLDARVAALDEASRLKLLLAWCAALSNDEQMGMMELSDDATADAATDLARDVIAPPSSDAVSTTAAQVVGSVLLHGLGAMLVLAAVGLAVGRVVRRTSKYMPLPMIDDDIPPPA